MSWVYTHYTERHNPNFLRESCVVGKMGLEFRTLVFNPEKGPDQEMMGTSKFTSFESGPDRAVAVVDLTQAYSKHANEITRTFELVRGKSVTVTDEIRCKVPAELWSFFHTMAEIELAIAFSAPQAMHTTDN